MIERDTAHLKDAMMFVKPNQFVWVTLLGVEENPRTFQANFKITEGCVKTDTQGQFQVIDVFRPYDVMDTEIIHGKS